MIKILNVGTQQTNAVINVTFDLKGGNLKNMSYQISATELKDMAEKQIIDFLKAQVEVERATSINEIIESKFKDLIETDIEKEEPKPVESEPSEPTVPVDPDADTEGVNPK